MRRRCWLALTIQATTRPSVRVRSKSTSGCYRGAKPARPDGAAARSCTGIAALLQARLPPASSIGRISHPNRGNQVKALTYQGAKKVRVETVPDPVLVERDDILLRVTATAICGSDLHIYRGKIPMMKDGDILGHEFMGVVEDAGPDVTQLRRGDRVV